MRAANTKTNDSKKRNFINFTDADGNHEESITED